VESPLLVLQDVVKEPIMKKRIPIIAVIILVALYFANKEEVNNMFKKEVSPVICDICVEECPCVEDICKCLASCECPNCPEI
jgi:hypothetical protein